MPGAGIVLFRQNQESNDCEYQILLVTSKKGSIGFPKGCQEIVDMSNGHHNYCKTALRELYEETGITQEQIVILNTEPIKEEKMKCYVTCHNKTMTPINKINYYYVAILNSLEFDTKLRKNITELTEVKWYTVLETFKLIPLANANSTRGLSLQTIVKGAS